MRASKGRTFLTILGVVIGIAAVTIVMSVGRSAQDLILGQLRNIGSNVIAILPGQEAKSGAPASAMGVVVKTLTNDDLAQLRKTQNVPHLVAIAGYVTGNASVESQKYTAHITFQGVSPDIINVEDASVASGRFFTNLENIKRANVVVLGSERAQNFFGTETPIGKSISIKKKRFTVIGVMAARGTVGFTNQDQNIYMPLRTAQKNLLGIDYVNFARAKVDRKEFVLDTISDIDRILMMRHHIKDGQPRDYTIKNTVSALKTVTTVTNILTYFLVAVAAIALIVGGIGVMNVMFIVLSQRMREIGLRKAVGATSGDIAKQFLAEAMIVSLVGGIIGVIVGVMITVMIAFGIQALGYSYTLFIAMDAIAVALGVALLIGMLFGAYPAYRASRVSPMESLRYE